MKILIVGDSYMPTAVFAAAVDGLSAEHEIRYLQIDETRELTPTTGSERSLREYVGSPQEIIEHLTDAEILVVHGAPVTEAVLETPQLQLICCARGGPVNVDLTAASRRGLPVVTAPGKNAEAVAELAVAFFIMLARRVRPAQTFVDGGASLQSAFEGRHFFGNNVSGKLLGLVGFGRVGRMVAQRANALGMRTLAFDPNIRDETLADAGVEPADFATLLGRSDFVSVHARATQDNENLFDAASFAAMKTGASFINTARETLVDEDALASALRTGRLRGAALDVVRPHADGPHPLLAHPNVVITPHIGGATYETLERGACMVAEEIARFASNKPLMWRINGGPMPSS